MKTNHIRKDWKFWVLVLGIAGIAALAGGSAFAAIFYFMLHAPLDYSVILGIAVGFMFFTVTLQKFDVRIDLGVWPL